MQWKKNLLPTIAIKSLTIDYCNKNFIAIEFCYNKIFLLSLKILYCNKKYCCYYKKYQREKSWWGMEKICVAVRVRPLVSSESFNRAYWNVEDNHISLHRLYDTPISGLSYTFCTHSYIHLSLSLSLSLSNRVLLH